MTLTQLITGTANSWPHPAAKPTCADSAVADYSRHVNAELAVVSPDATRLDPDLAGHRLTDLRTAAHAA